MVDFPLLSDVARSVGRSYDVLRPATERYAGFPERVSYLVDPEGTTRRAYRVADVNAHADEVLADVAELQRNG